jgi:hypothetical protein
MKHDQCYLTESNCQNNLFFYINKINQNLKEEDSYWENECCRNTFKMFITSANAEDTAWPSTFRTHQISCGPDSLGHHRSKAPNFVICQMKYLHNVLGRYMEELKRAF